MFSECCRVDSKVFLSNKNLTSDIELLILQYFLIFCVTVSFIESTPQVNLLSVQACPLELLLFRGYEAAKRCKVEEDLATAEPTLQV